MALGDYAGRAFVRYPNYRAQAECDRCGTWYPLDKLKKQFQWAGPSLMDTGYLVCPRCLDKPQDQNRVLILPPDPIPRQNARPSPDVTPPAPANTPGNQGFQQYVLGAPIFGDYPTVKARVLTAVAALSGIPIPGGLLDRSKTIVSQNTSAQLMAAASRSYLLIYNPTNPQVQISLGSPAVWGATDNLIIGPGQAWFCATAQNLASPFQGDIAYNGLLSGMTVFAWEAP